MLMARYARHNNIPNCIPNSIPNLKKIAAPKGGNAQSAYNSITNSILLRGCMLSNIDSISPKKLYNKILLVNLFRCLLSF